MLIFLWMTRSITDDIPGWGILFNGRAGDGTVSVSVSSLRLGESFLFVVGLEFEVWLETM